MKKFFTIVLALISIISQDVISSPRINFNDLLIYSEINPSSVVEARKNAISRGLPINILTSNKIMIDVKGMEDGQIVYAVMTDLINPYNGGYTAFYEDVVKVFDSGSSRMDFGNGNITDNTGGMYDPVLSSKSGINKFLMIPDWTFDRVYLLDYMTGNLVDTAFIHSSTPQLQSPKHALPLPNGKQIVVADQISDLVQRFDTNGTYVGFFAPASGVNNAIIDNMRGIRILTNRNLLATVANGASANTIQQFDSGGVHIGTFISSNVSSPFDILIRNSDILISNSAGGVRITRFSSDGNYLSNFYGGISFAFPQQMYQLENGRVLVAAFSTPSGLAVLDSTGNLIQLMTGVTSLRGIYLMGNGRYMVSNSTGVHEVDSSSGAPIRTIITGSNLQYISLYNPDQFVSVGNDPVTVSGYELFANYPNPFNPTTTIKFSVAENSQVKITVYDISGKTVSQLLNENVTAGTHEITFDGEGLNSGVYFYRLEANDFSQYRKMMLIK